MEGAERQTPQSSAQGNNAPENTAPTQSVHTRRRRTGMRTCSRCFVYDTTSETVDVRPMEEVEGRLQTPDYSLGLADVWIEDWRYQKIPLRPRQKHVALFVNKDCQAMNSEKNFKTEEDFENNQYLVLFAELDLRGPGVWNKLLLMSGWLSTLYVSRDASETQLNVQPPSNRPAPIGILQ